jgi:ABC-type transport system involved in multi-copper enzyme maturation permease subunit
MNMLLLNLAQIVVIVFLATDLFKRDKRINTVEVFYIRSMTNASYIFGRILGIFIVFFLLNLLILIITAIIVLIFGKVSVSWQPYLWYLLLIPLPVFVFLMGLTVLLMRLIKNQAIVVLIVLGYYAAVIFYLRDQWNFLFDFPAMNLPLIYSDFIGIANIRLVIIQRAIYVFLGLIFLSVTAIFFTRLSQSVLVKRILTISVIFMIVVTVFFAGKYDQSYHHTFELRARMTGLNNRYSAQPNIKADNYQIDLEHSGGQLTVKTKIVYHNPGNESLPEFYLCLNPGLVVQEVVGNHQKMRFERQDHLLLVYPEKPLPPETRDSCWITYGGTIDEAVCYLDIPEKNQHKLFYIWLYQIAKKYCFVTDQFVLLSRECLWYPEVSLPASPGNLDQLERSFADFFLTVKCRSDLKVISQGKKLETDTSSAAFHSEVPLPGISLVIGPYEQRNLQVDGIDYYLYFLPDHNYFDQYFSNIGDTLAAIVDESRLDYEVKSGLNYPYRQISFVEVPIQFYSYERIWTVTCDFIQPEQIWLPESAVLLPSADFRLLKEFMEGRLDRSNQTLTAIEIETSILKQFISATFLGGSANLGRMGGPNIKYKPDFNPFPTFYSFTNFIKSADWPIINTALEAYLYKRVHSTDTDLRMAMFAEGLTKPELVSQQLSKKSLAGHLSSGDTLKILPDIVRTKGAYLFNLIKDRQNKAAFDTKLNTLIEKYRFRQVDIKDFFRDTFQQPLDSIFVQMNDWYHSTSLPGFLVSEVRLSKVIDKNRVRYQIIFNISNPENVDGLAEVSFQFGRSGRGPMSSADTPEEPLRIIYLFARESKQIGIVLDEEPRAININYLIASNIPIVYSKQFEKAEDAGSVLPFDGENTIEWSDVYNSPDEIVVDNEDEGFLVFNQNFQSVLKQWIQGDEQGQEKSYERFSWWNPAKRWTLIKNASFFGKFIHSAYYIRSGNKNNRVSWQTDLSDEGLYDVYNYMFDKQAFWRRRRGGSGENIRFGDFTYTIYHSAGQDQVTLDADHAVDGWNFLGTYYFSKGKALIELSDQSNGELVIADAVKWVKN